MSTAERINNAESVTPEAARACAVIDAKFAEVEMDEKLGGELIVVEDGREYLNLELTCTSGLINSEHGAGYSAARVLLERPGQEEKLHEPNFGYSIRIREIIDQPGRDNNEERSRLETLFLITSGGKLKVKRRIDASIAPGESVDNPERSDTFALSSGVRLSGAHPELVAAYKQGVESLFGSSGEEQENFWLGIEGTGVEVTDPVVVDETTALIESAQPVLYGASAVDVEAGIAAAHQANEARTKIAALDSKLEDATTEHQELTSKILEIKNDPRVRLADFGINIGNTIEMLQGESHVQLHRDRLEKGKLIKKLNTRRSALEARLGELDSLADNSIGRGTVGDKYLVGQAEKRRKA